MRAVIVSHRYANPAARGKLQALAGQGVALAAAVPAVWRAPAGGTPLHTTFAEDGGVRIVPIPTRGRDPAGGPGAWRVSALRRLLTDFRPELVQLEEEPATRVSTAVTRIARKLGIRTIVLTAESLPHDHGLLARRRRQKTLERASGVLGVNALASGRVHVEFPGQPLASIPPTGVPVPKAPVPAPREGGAPLSIGFVGRLVPVKGLDVLLRACAKLYGAWKLTVAGTGPEQEKLEALAERLGIASRVTWLGGVPHGELASLWPRLDCLVAPSRTGAEWVETYPLQVLDAMANGVTVVVSDSGALPETVGKAGLVFGEGHPDGLRDVLEKLLGDGELRERLATEGRRRVIAEYIDDAVARRTLAFWEQVLAGTKA